MPHNKDIVEVSSLSKEYLHAVVVADSDPTANTIAFAFTELGGTPSSFVNGSWPGGTTVTEDGRSGWIARTALLGPGESHELSAGRYEAWYQLTDGPEIIVEQFDLLKVT